MRINPIFTKINASKKVFDPRKEERSRSFQALWNGRRLFAEIGNQPIGTLDSTYRYFVACLIFQHTTNIRRTYNAHMLILCWFYAGHNLGIPKLRGTSRDF